MVNKLTKALIVMTTVATVSVTPLSNFASASENSIKPQVESLTKMSKDGNMVIQSSAQNISGNIEVIEGTDQDWTKIKVIQGDRVDIVERKDIDGVPTITVTNLEGAIGDNHIIQNIGDEVFVNNEIVERQEVNVPNSKMSTVVPNVAVSSSDRTWYTKTFVQGSFNSDFAIVSVLVGVVTAFMSVPVSIATTLAVGIIGYNIPYTWYTKLTLWDAADYRPLHWIHNTTYADPQLTIQTAYDDYYL
ncbi:hypothetical protein [Paenibacillus xylanilyticus]|uniref:Uncharacterized protein n=1 Tax=Paenibacillus xylanilyticus TaxID=248903 RepID=A0A7Y6C4U9_9BACL|nr:hypothetical protein [Paenibacillus xylanilyticus]NUU80058.1 hypothetical protein [Paenibacillus xylanilyticus]